MALVWKFSTHKGDALLVLLAMADWCDDAGLCYPSIKKLAQKSRMTDRGVQKVIRRLETSGEVVIDEKGGIVGGRKLANVYRLPVAEIGMGAQRSPMPERVNGEAPKGERRDNSRVNVATPHTSLEPPREPSEGKDLFSEPAIEHPEVPPAMRSPELLAAWGEWKQHRAQKRQKLTPLTVKKQIAQLAQWILLAGPGLAVAAINHSIAHGYMGLFAPKGSQMASPPRTGPITQGTALRMPPRA